MRWSRIVSRSMGPWVVAVAAGILFLATPPAAEAGGFELGANIGFIDFDSDVSDETELRYDVRAGYHFRRGLGVEVELIRAESDLNTELTTVMFNLVASWRTDRKISPYTLVGIGFSDIELDRPGFPDQSDDGFAYQAGVGLRFELGELDGLGAKIEATLLSEDTFGGNGTYVNLVGGLHWRFGRR